MPDQQESAPAEAAPAGTVRLVAHALLLGERLEHRHLAHDRTTGVDPVRLRAPPGITVMAFRWGAAVAIGADEAAGAAFMATLRPHVSNPLPAPIEERALIETGAAEDGLSPQGVILLRDLDPARLAVVSDVLAKSAALADQETALARTLDGMEPVIAGLRRRGRLAISSRGLLRSIGDALAARNRSVARVQAEDKPDLLWDHPELERLHARLVDEFELRERAAALDRKLVLIGESVQTLLQLIEARRSLGLEVAVALLIAMELLAALYELLPG